MRVEILTAQGVRAQVRPELVDPRDAGRDIHLRDLVVRNRVQVLDQGPQGVAVRDDQHAAARPQIRHDRVVPVGQQPGRDIGQGLGARADLGRQGRVPGVEVQRLRVLLAHRRRRDLIRAPPGRELLLAVLAPHLGLGPALQRPVVPPVEPPRPADTDPVPVRGRQGQLGGPDRTPLQRGVREGGQHGVLSQQRSGAGRFVPAAGGQVSVSPAGEHPGGVPFALPVAQHDQAVGHGPITALPARPARAASGPG